MEAELTGQRTMQPRGGNKQGPRCSGREREKEELQPCNSPSFCEKRVQKPYLSKDNTHNGLITFSKHSPM